MSTNTELLAMLCDLLTAFCAAEGLTPASADELLYVETDPRRRAWLAAFVTLWDAEQNRSAS